MIAYNLGSLRRRLVLPLRVGNWSLTSLQQREYVFHNWLRHRHFLAEQGPSGGGMEPCEQRGEALGGESTAPGLTRGCRTA